MNELTSQLPEEEIESNIEKVERPPKSISMLQKVDPKEVSRDMKAAGFSILNAENIKQLKNVGIFAEEEGAISVAAGMLALSTDSSLRILKRLTAAIEGDVVPRDSGDDDDVSENRERDPEYLSMLSKAASPLIKQITENAKVLINLRGENFLSSPEEAQNRKGPRPKSPAPGAMVQINNIYGKEEKNVELSG
jgi:uncharacterized protein (UPF0335 family)